MEPEVLLNFISRVEKLKCNTRHCSTSSGIPESVASHSFGCAVFALLLRDEFPELDMNKVLEMCIIHDFGEAVTGDIPTFQKTGTDEKTEAQAIKGLLDTLPEMQKERWSHLFEEMEALETNEAKLYKIIDKLEAVHQHNLSPLSTWIPLEYELNLTYGEEEAEAFPYTQKLRKALKRQTLKKTQRDN